MTALPNAAVNTTGPPVEALAGLVERVTFHNADTGFCVLRVKVRGQHDLVTVVGHAATIAAGEWLRMSGTWFNDRIHGLQFKAAFLRASLPTTLEGIKKYLGSGHLAMPTSGDTVRRLIRRMTLPEAPPPRVVAVDDWALRKGRTYGTIVVDLEHRRVVDLLSDRMSATVAEWLRQRPRVEVVARDRSTEYARAVGIGAPGRCRWRTGCTCSPTCARRWSAGCTPSMPGYGAWPRFLQEARRSRPAATKRSAAPGRSGWHGRNGTGSGGRATRRCGGDTWHAPIPAKTLAASLPKRAWRWVAWREGSNTMLAGRFAAVRVRPAHRDYNRPAPRPEEWLLVKLPKGEPEPTKYWLATLPPETSLRAMVDQAKLRWRIERDYQNLKQELGLGHYEGRGWRGFHHHAALCIAAYAFLIAERGAFPPSEGFSPPPLKGPALPTGYRPRGVPDPA